MILKGILQFRGRFRGELVTETMLVAGVNDSQSAIEKQAAYLLELQPFRSYLSIPTRPPAESWVKPPAPETLQTILNIMTEKVSFIDLLFETEAPDFISTGNMVEDILGITAVHPLREEALGRVVEALLAAKKIIAIFYRGDTFYCAG